MNAGQFAQLLPKLTSLEERLLDLEAIGLDFQVVSPSPTQYYYWAEPDLAREIVELGNDAVSALCSARPDRFGGVGTVALQHPTLAADQLRRLVSDRGFHGVQISTLVGEDDLSNPRFDEFWHAAQEVGAVVFIHPWGSTIGNRLNEFYLMNTIGQPLETCIALSKLIFSGTFDRFPGLRVVGAHGGGYLPSYVERSDHAHLVRPEARACQHPPSHYLRSLYYDTVVFGPDHVRGLVNSVGVGQLMFGCDYPFDMGNYDPAYLLGELSLEHQEAIAGGNAIRVLGLRGLQ